jgi:mycothiol system anti-sigma-R factor
MSCGKHHDTDCSEVLERVFVFIDSELEEADHATIQQHLDECWPCLKEFDLETKVKALVKKSCSEHAPETLRERVLLSIHQVQVTVTEE